MGVPEGYLIAFVRFGGRVCSYSTPQETWYLDQVKYDSAFRRRGMIPPPGFPDTFGVPVVSGDVAASKFLRGVAQYQVSRELLRSQYLEAGSKDAGEELRALPFIFADFDSNHFASMEYEPLGFERYLPDGWSFSFGDVMVRVPVESQYWKQ